MKTKVFMAVLIGLLVLLVSTPGIPAGGRSAGKPEAKAPPELETVTFVNTPYWSSPPWYPPANETDTYRLLLGGLHWAGEDPHVDCVVYTNGAPAGAYDAIVASFNTWDVETLAGIYGAIHDGGTHPEVANSVSWGSIDGPGGIIAQTSFSYWPNTKELVAFDIVFDADEDWSTDETEETFDVQAIMTHELGHTLALDDLRSPRDGALTMHAYTWPGDTGKRSLGAGDILGIRAIYGQ